MSIGLTAHIAWNDLRAALVKEDAQLERDIHAARVRELPVLAADLCRIRTLIGRLLKALDKTENQVQRRDDYAPADERED